MPPTTTPSDSQARLVSTPFVASWLGRARTGDRFVANLAERAWAWAQWAVPSLNEMTGVNERIYAGLLLDGKFYDPKGRGPHVRPHLEIPSRRLGVSDPAFPDRLALMGNGLAFPWWVLPEVTAARRSLFNSTSGPLDSLVETLSASADQLSGTLQELIAVASPQWKVIEALLVSAEDGLAPSATGSFSREEVASYFPAGRNLELDVVFDERLAEKSGRWASRRVGVWQLRGRDLDAGTKFSVGVLTPRLTASSQFRDNLFAPERESPAALLVRGLVLRRLVSSHLQPVSATVAEPEPIDTRPPPHLRMIVAQVGAKIPEASTEAAVFFLHSYLDAEQAWSRLLEWSVKSGTKLTVVREGFIAAHRNALRYLRRAEEPERDDINVVLPLGWHENRVVRVTFSRPPTDDT